MPKNSKLEIGVISDEISRDLAEAIALGRNWGISRFELREGGSGRYPAYTPDEVRIVDEALRAGARITAVSPGILKGHVEDKERLSREMEQVLPKAIELGSRFETPVLIVFGLERYEGEPASNRADVLKIFENVAEAADEAGMIVAIENEPNFWVDRPDGTASLLEELNHPSVRLNWDPANLHWGGHFPRYEDFAAIQPHIANLHIKDYYPTDPDHPWRPVGEGSTPWPDLIKWIHRETALEHITLETHCTPLIESSRQSIDALRQMLSGLERET